MSCTLNIDSQILDGDLDISPQDQQILDNKIKNTKQSEKKSSIQKIRRKQQSLFLSCNKKNSSGSINNTSKKEEKYDLSFQKYQNCSGIELRINNFLDSLALQIADPAQKQYDYFHKKRQDIFNSKNLGSSQESSILCSPNRDRKFSTMTQGGYNSCISKIQNNTNNVNNNNITDFQTANNNINSSNNNNTIQQQQQSLTISNISIENSNNNSVLNNSGKITLNLRKSTIHRKRSDNISDKVKPISSFSSKETLSSLTDIMQVNKASSENCSNNLNNINLQQSIQQQQLQNSENNNRNINKKYSLQSSSNFSLNQILNSIKQIDQNSENQSCSNSKNSLQNSDSDDDDDSDDEDLKEGQKTSEILKFKTQEFSLVFGEKNKTNNNKEL